MKKWSEEVWVISEDIYQQILRHPFVSGLTEGSLESEKFIYYLSQDSLYLSKYFKVLAHIASRIGDMDYADSFIKFSSDGIFVERSLHESFLTDKKKNEVEMSPTCALYTSTLLSQAYQPVEVEAASVLPCFWVYQRVGEYIYGKSGSLTDNPFQAWIETYADSTFVESTKRAIEICDSLAEHTSLKTREKMTRIFRYCTRLEWLFWDSAWNLEKWKI